MRTMNVEDTLQKNFESLRQAVDDLLAREGKRVQDQLRAAVDAERRSILEQADHTACAAVDVRAGATAEATAATQSERTSQAAYDDGFDAGRADGWETGRRHGTLEGRQLASTEAAARELTTAQRLVESIRQIDAATAVPEMLDLLMRCVLKEAARAAVLIVRGAELHGWKFFGFGARTENPTEFRQAVLGAGVIEEAIRSGASATTFGPVRIPAPSFAELPLGRKAIGVPIIIQGRVVAVLYADQGKRADDADHPAEGVAWPVAVEIMTRHASRCLEANGALRTAPGPSASSHGAPEPAVAGGAR